MARLYAAVGQPMSAEWLERPSAFQTEVAVWAAARGVPLFDLWPVFRKAVERGEEPLNYEIDNHWTPAGHAVAADAILEWLARGEFVNLPLLGIPAARVEGDPAGP